MLISSMGRYAVLTLLDLAEHRGSFIPVRQIAERQELSQKYLERILRTLAAQGLVEGTHGKGGGYRLCREPDKYKVSEILRVTEGTLAPVACLKPGAAPCELADRCRTLPMWKELNCVINNFFDSYTVADLTQKDKDYNNWVI